jgi:transketolase
MKKENTGIIDIPSAFFNELYEIAKIDKNVIFITADQGAWALERFRSDMPKQFFNLGPSEQNMISVAAGLSLSGKHVFVHGISPFITQRCFEQVKIDLCLTSLPVTIIGGGSSLTYSFHGSTHQAIEDIAMMRALPGLTILNPCEEISAKVTANLAYKCNGPVYVKMDKGFFPIKYSENTNFSDGIFQLLKGRDICIVSTGIMTQESFALADKLNAMSISASIIDIHRIKPLNKELLIKYIEDKKAIVTIEEQSIIGGIGSILCEVLAEIDTKIPIIRFGINDEYPKHYGDRSWLHEYHGLDVLTLSKKIETWYNNMFSN